MWKSSETPIALEPAQLTTGLYIWLDVSWSEHPFLTKKFLIANKKQLGQLSELELQGRLYYYPGKSNTVPLALPGPADAQPVAAPIVNTRLIALDQPELTVSAEEVARREKAELLHRQKDPTVLAEVGWERAADTVRDALLNLARTPRAAGEQLASLSRETAASIAEGEQVLLHLLGDKQGDGPQFHALNVMTLSMLVGKAAELTEGELADLALGALAHDAGKDKVPPHILKNANRKKHEEDFYRQHVQFGLTFAQESEVFSRRALAVIADHHEALDGSGFPSGKSQLDVGARIVGMVNRYDRLCSPEAEHAEALMPTEALAQMYRTESSRYDPRLLALMIKMLGVFPPGTLVRLSDDSIALVVAPGKDSLRPTVLVYAPQLNKDSAPTLDLSSDTALRIKTALKPSALAPKVTNWFRPRQRLSYFYSSDALER